MKKIIPTLSIIAFSLTWQGCSGESSSSADSDSFTKTVFMSYSDSQVSSSSISEADLPNYSRAIYVNNLIGHGINFGNSWDSGQNNPKPGVVYDYADDMWSNPIEDEWFQIAKAAGFQSIRLPVRWNQTAQNEPPYTLQASRVEGVKRHIKMANDLGMVVIINIHHYNELFDDPEGQLPKFYGLWEQIAEEFKDFSNDSLIFEVLNESRGKLDSKLNELSKKAIEIIRKTNPERTIMLNPGNWGKFELMDTFKDIKDSNIIITGHYYEPFSFSHQGTSNDNPCRGPWTSTKEQRQKIQEDFLNFVFMAKRLFPGRNNTSIPLNMGEFGASMHCPDVADEANRAKYINDLLDVVNQLGISWNIWGFTGVGFDVYDKSEKAWLPTMIQVLQAHL